MNPRPGSEVSNPCNCWQKALDKARHICIVSFKELTRRSSGAPDMPDCQGVERSNDKRLTMAAWPSHGSPRGCARLSQTLRTSRTQGKASSSPVGNGVCDRLVDSVSLFRLRQIMPPVLYDVHPPRCHRSSPRTPGLESPPPALLRRQGGRKTLLRESQPILTEELRVLRRKTCKHPWDDFAPTGSLP